MEISITLNNELVYDKEFTKRDILKYAAIGTGTLLITLSIVYISTNATIIATTKPIGILIGEELAKIFETSSDMTQIDAALKQFFPIDLETAEYIAKLTGKCFKDAFMRDIQNDAVPVLRILNNINRVRI